jgi:Ulp1 family protease
MEIESPESDTDETILFTNKKKREITQTIDLSADTDEEDNSHKRRHKEINDIEVSASNAQASTKNTNDAVYIALSLEELLNLKKSDNNNDMYWGVELLKTITDENKKEILFQKYNVDITGEKLQCMKDGEWLNDEVINFYMGMLKEKDSKENSSETSFYFSTFFMTKLIEKRNGQATYTYKNVERWTKKCNIFDMEKIFIPINIKNLHWVMVVIYMKTKEISFYDSLYQENFLYYYKILMNWLEDESKKMKVSIDPKLWRFNEGCSMSPQQTNGCDCGVFTICCADYITNGLPLLYEQKDMSLWRCKIVCSMLRGKIY